VARRLKKGRKKVTPRSSPSAHDSLPSTGSTSTAKRSKSPGPQQRPLHETVQLKLRFSEALRRKLAEAAVGNERSLNAEIVSRLEKSFLESVRVSRLVADALLKGLDDDVISEMTETIIEDWQSAEAEAAAYDAYKEQLMIERENK
jgi:hypothetical protein